MAVSNERKKSQTQDDTAEFLVFRTSFQLKKLHLLQATHNIPNTAPFHPKQKKILRLEYHIWVRFECSTALSGTVCALQAWSDTHCTTVPEGKWQWFTLGSELGLGQ